MSEQIDYYMRNHGKNRDSQRSKVYKWGNVIKKRLPEINKFQIKKLIEHSCTSMDIYPPHVDFSYRRKSVACYRPGIHTVSFPAEHGSWSHNMEVIVHETAHAVHHELMKKLKHKSWIEYEESHGPGFMAVNIFLLVQYSELTTEELKYQAWNMGIRVGNIFNYMEEE